MNAMTLESDVALAMRGDEAAYRRLVETCANTVCSIALAIVRNVAASRFAWERETDPVVALQHRREWMKETTGRALGVVCSGIAFMFAIVRAL